MALKKEEGTKVNCVAKKLSLNPICHEHLGLHCLYLFCTAVSDDAVVELQVNRVKYLFLGHDAHPAATQALCFTACGMFILLWGRFRSKKPHFRSCLHSSCAGEVMQRHLCFCFSLPCSTLVELLLTPSKSADTQCQPARL